MRLSLVLIRQGHYTILQIRVWCHQGEDFEFVVLPPDEIRPMIKRSSIGFVRDIAVQTVR